METATDLLRKDLAFRAIINSAVAEAWSQFNERDIGEITERDARELAAITSAIALKRAFDEDAEITRLRIENEHYKATALRMANMTVPVNLITLPGNIEGVKSVG